MNRVILLLGTNLGDKNLNLKIAIENVEKELGKVVKFTGIIETEPFGFQSNNNFLNQAIEIHTHFSPYILLKKIKNIEKSMGRKLKTEQNEVYLDREIDIDIVFYNSMVYYCKKLQIPHKKHVKEREFSIDLIRKL